MAEVVKDRALRVASEAVMNPQPTHGTVSSIVVDAISRAGLLLTERHVAALKACEAYWANPNLIGRPNIEPFRAVYDAGAPEAVEPTPMLVQAVEEAVEELRFYGEPGPQVRVKLQAALARERERRP